MNVNKHKLSFYFFCFQIKKDFFGGERRATGVPLPAFGNKVAAVLRGAFIMNEIRRSEDQKHLRCVRCLVWQHKSCGIRFFLLLPATAGVWELGVHQDWRKHSIIRLKGNN